MIHRAFSHFFKDINNRNDNPIFNNNNFDRNKISLKRVKDIHEYEKKIE